MKEKSVRRKPEAVVSNYMETPEDILSMITGLEVLVDIMFVDNLAFLVSVSKRLNFTTIEYIPNRSKKELARSNNKILYLYKSDASKSILFIWILSLTV